MSTNEIDVDALANSLAEQALAGGRSAEVAATALVGAAAGILIAWLDPRGGIAVLGELLRGAEDALREGMN